VTQQPPHDPPQSYRQPQPDGHPPFPYSPYPATPNLDPPRRTGTNGFAIASLVVGSIGGVLLSVIFGIVALTQIRRYPQDGRGLAIAGLALSGAWVAVFGVLIAVGIATGADGDSRGHVTSGSVEVESLKVGDCVNGVRENQEFRRLPTLPCAEPHQAEVFALITIPESSWPGDTAIQEWADGCVDELEVYSSAAAEDDTLDAFYLHPTRRSWVRGDRTVTCLVVNPDRRTGSVKG
jgi:hypothetical protein